MHFRQLCKELSEIVEIVRTRCGQRLRRHGYLRHAGLADTHSRFDFEALLATPARDAPFVVLDTETTGFEPYGGDRIVQVALIEYRGLEPTGRELCSLVNPGIAIPAPSTAVHGITDDQVSDAPTIDELIADIAAFIDGHVLVGHHVAFDLRFLERPLRRRLLRDLRNPRIDTVALHHADGGAPDCISLDAVAAICGTAVHERHDALGDARTCGEIFVHHTRSLTTASTTVGELLEMVHPIAGLSPRHPAQGGSAMSTNEQRQRRYVQ